jgi:hypothetical protein
MVPKLGTIEGCTTVRFVWAPLVFGKRGVAKREPLGRLAAHFRVLAAEVERAIAAKAGKA